MVRGGGGEANVRNTKICCGAFFVGGGGTGFRFSGRRQNSGSLLWDLEVTSLRIKGRPVLSGRRGPLIGHLRHCIGCKPVLTMTDGESAFFLWEKSRLEN